MSEQKANVGTLTAQDIMTPNAYSVTTDQTIESIMKDLIDKKISGAPVVDKSKNVISVISEADLMKFAAAGGLKRTVSEFLDKLSSSEKVLKVEKKDLFKNIFKHFLLNPVRRVIVVDSSDKLQGIISRRDILKAFLMFEEAKEGEASNEKSD